MNIFINKHFLLFYGILFITVVADCVKVSVYYESLCPDSVNFITKQLYPNYLPLKNYIDLELIPYGKATQNFINNKWEFECQHGKNECRGNKYQACALKQNNGQDVDVNFVNCVMDERNPSNIKGIENCANKTGVNWTEIEKCINSGEGDNLLAFNGNKTYQLEPSLSFVPTIIFNDKYDILLQEKSLTDFPAVICNQINKTDVEFCKNQKNIRSIRRITFWDYIF